MSTIRKTGAPKPPRPPKTNRRQAASCGPPTERQRAMDSCSAAWSTKASRGKGSTKTAKSREPKKPAASCSGWTTRSTRTVDGCSAAGWGRGGRSPSGC